MKLFKNENGQGLVEYALLLVLVAVVVIGILALLGPQINIAFSKVIAALNGAGIYEYTISSPSITMTNLPGPNCRFTAAANVSITENGVPVSGSVNVTGSVSGIVNMTISGSVSGGSGSISGTRNVSGSCPGGGSATFLVGGAVATWSQ